MKQKINLFLLTTFIILRTFLDAWMRTQNMWVAYAIEASLALTFVIVNFRHISFTFSCSNRKRYFHFVLSAVLGFLIAGLGIFWGAGTPFDFSDPILWVQLIVVAPILEEALFRLLTWNTLSSYIRKPKTLIAITAILFSLSHLAALIYVPKEFYGFVIYQGIYTLILGIYWGLARSRSGSWTAGVILHFVLNLSFGLTHTLVSKMGSTPMTQAKPTKSRALFVEMPIDTRCSYVVSIAAVFSNTRVGDLREQS